MKPKYWNKGKSYLSNNDKILKSIIEKFSYKEKVNTMISTKESSIKLI